MIKFFLTTRLHEAARALGRPLLALALLLATAGAARAQVSFTPAVWNGVGGAAGYIALADVNGDNRPDLITSNSGSRTVSVLLNQAGAPGTFQTAVTYPLTAYPAFFSAGQVAAGDVNGDGRPDLVVVCQNDSVRVLLNQAAAPGTFGPAVPYATAATAGQGLALADVDGDGRLDVLHSTTTGLGVLRNQAAAPGTFGSPTHFPTPGIPVELVSADFNNDGLPDAAMSCQYRQAVVLRNSPNQPGLFDSFTTYNWGGSYNPGLTVGDFNVDGLPDLASSDTNFFSVSALINVPAAPGTFVAGPISYTNNFTTPQGLATGDLTGDGLPDIVACNPGGSGRPTGSQVSIMVNTGSPQGTFTGVAQLGSGGTAPMHAVIGDLNGDGRPDIATCNAPSFSVGVLLNTTVFPTANNALDFDGTDDYVSVAATPALSFTSAFTIETWLKPTGTGSAVQSVAGNTSAAQSSGYIFPRTDDQWQHLSFWLHRGGGWSQYTVPYAANIGIWHHVAATYDGTTVLVYVDGVATPAVATGNVVPGPVATNGNPLTLGAQPGSGDYYRGALDETRLYGAVLTPAQIRADMYSTRPAVPGSLAAYYSYDQGVAGGNNAGLTNLPTAWGSGPAGTLVNFALSGATSNWVRSFPTITAITPTSGRTGTSVAITGTNLRDATSFRFNGTAVASFTTPLSDYTASATVPAYATTGPVSVASALLARYDGPVFTLVNQLTVSSTTVVAGGSYSGITVTGTGRATLGGDVLVDGPVVVNSGGVLNDGCFVLGGPGSFTLAAGATLGICNPQGIDTGAAGAIQTTGGRSFSPDASYVYNGTTAQRTGAGLPGQVRNLTTTNNNPLTLTAATSVARALTLAGAGNLDLNGQPLTLLSSASGTALVVNSGPGVVQGAATVQRYLATSNPGTGYRHYSAPVSGSTVADLATSGYVPTVNAAYNSSATPGTVRPYPTVFGYDESRLAGPGSSLDAFNQGWYSPASLGDALAVGQGYAVSLPGTALVDFVGTLTTGPQTVALSRGAGANAGLALVGNPYPAPLDWSQLNATTDRPNVDGALYVFASSGPYAGSYRTYANGQGGNPVVPMGQGFFVRVSAGQRSGSLTFRNPHRLTVPDATAMQRPTADLRPQLTLELRTSTGLADALYLYAEAGATPGLDREYDAGKLANPTGLNLSSTSATGEQLAIDGRPAFAAATVLPLQVGVPAAGTYTLAAAALANLPAGLTAYLRDAQTGQTVALGAGSSYSFPVTAAEAQALVAGRFTVQFSPAAPLAATPAALAAQVLVYPSPAHGQVSVTLPGVAGASAVQVELLNTLGQVTRRQQAALPAGGTTLAIATDGLAPGVYVLRLTAGPATLTRRVVLE